MDHQHMNHGAFQHSSLRSILLLIALCFHSVFEVRHLFLQLEICSCVITKGLAIGLQTDTGEMLAIFMAVMMHKAVMAFSLGLNIAQSSLSVGIISCYCGKTLYQYGFCFYQVRAFVFSSITFSLSSPLGVAIGQLLWSMVIVYTLKLHIFNPVLVQGVYNSPPIVRQ